MHLSLTAAVAVLASTAAAKSIVVPLTKRNDSSIESSSDLKSFARREGFNVAYKYAQGAKNFASNTGQSLPWFSLEEAEQVIANLTSTLARLTKNAKRGQSSQNLVAQAGYSTGTLKYGSNHVEIPMLFDSGSSDIWVRSSDNKDGDYLYNPSASSSGTNLNKKYSIAYGDGSKVTNDVWADDLVFNGLVAHNQPFGVSTGPDIGVKGGIAGMAWPQISSSRSEVLVRTMFQQGQLDQNLFAFNLKHLTLQIGDYDTNAYNGDLVWVPLTSQSYWVTDQVSFVHNGIRFVNPNQAVIDSGTTAVVMPVLLAQLFWATFPFAFPITQDLNTFFWYFPCNSNFGKISFHMAGLEIDLSMDDLILGKDKGFCVGSIYGQLATPKNVVIVGDVVMDKMYTVFDYGNKRIGGAIAK